MEEYSGLVEELSRVAKVAQRESFEEFVVAALATSAAAHPELC